jgi:hydrogenase expression/formation protein HypC
MSCRKFTALLCDFKDIYRNTPTLKTPLKTVLLMYILKTKDQNKENKIMCLAVPMQIVEIAGKNVAVVEADGAKVRISTSLITNPQVGDFVIIHAGYAIERINQKEADLRILLFKELAEISQIPDNKATLP